MGKRRKNEAETAFRRNGRGQRKQRIPMRDKLKPIERRPDGSLPRMRPGQRRRANSLIRRECCNYDNDNCILLNDGEECVCVQSISYSVCCTWFRHVVLLLDKPLETELFYSGDVKRGGFRPRLHPGEILRSLCGRSAQKAEERQRQEKTEQSRQLGTEKARYYKDF